MPQIPVYQQRTAATAPLQLAPLSAEAAAAPAAALGRLSDTAAQIGPQIADAAQRIEISKNAWQLADTTAKTLGELQQFRGELAADEDYDSHSQKFLEKAKEIEDRVAPTLSGGLRQVWRQDFRQIAQQNSLSVAVDAQKLKAEKVRTELGSTLFALSELTGTDQATDDALRAQARLAIAGSAATGNLSVADSNTLIRKFEQDSSEAQIRRDVLRDPEDAERKLAAGMYTNLSGETQAIWAQRISAAAEAAQRRQLADEDRSFRLGERARKLAADAMAKEGDHLLATGKLTAAWIESKRDELDPADFRHFYEKLNGGGGEAPRDADTYIDLRDRSGRGEDVRDDARVAYRQGRIRVSDYNIIVGEVENQRPGWYRQGHEYISTMAATSDLNPDPAAAATKATMLDQWNQWANEHPKASDREARTAFQDIVVHNGIVEINSLPLPRFSTGNRFSMDLDATEAATVKAWQEKRLSDQDFERESQILKRWRAANTRAKSTQSAP